MNQFASIVASYEPTKYVDTTPPAAAIEAEIADPVGHTVTFQGEYSDDTAISLRGLGAGDIIGPGPHSFRHAATVRCARVNSDRAPRGRPRTLYAGRIAAGPTAR